MALCLAFEKLDRDEVEVVCDANPLSRIAGWNPVPGRASQPTQTGKESMPKASRSGSDKLAALIAEIEAEAYARGRADARKELLDVLGAGGVRPPPGRRHRAGAIRRCAHWIDSRRSGLIGSSLRAMAQGPTSLPSIPTVSPSTVPSPSPSVPRQCEVASRGP